MLRINQIYGCFLIVNSPENTEAATGNVLQKKVFLKISEISQEKPCVGISFY